MDQTNIDLRDIDPAQRPTATLLQAMDRRSMGKVSAAFLTAMGPVGALLAGTTPAQAATAITDADILNFALQLEYLEGEFYARAFTGTGLPDSSTSGTGTFGPVNGGAQVPFTNTFYTDIAANLALNEQQHVNFLRSALGSAAVARPTIDLAGGFQGAASAAGILAPGQVFNPFGDQVSFLIGAFVFEDVGVTAYAGAAALIQNKEYLAAAASILSVEAYHGGILRAALIEAGGNAPYFAQLISNLRAQASNAQDDQGILLPGTGTANIAPTDGNGLVFTRTPSQVINIVTNGGHGKGGFFPNGLNGRITS